MKFEVLMKSGVILYIETGESCTLQEIKSKWWDAWENDKPVDLEIVLINPWEIAAITEDQ